VKRGKGETVKVSHVLIMLLFLLLLAGISHVWVNFKRTQLGYSLSQLKKEIVQIEEYNRKLKLERAFLTSPERLERRAVKEFALKHPLPKQVVFLP